MVLLLQIGQLDNLRHGVWGLHVVNFEGVEVAGYNPAGVHVVWQTSSVSPTLLKRCQLHPVRLLRFSCQIHMGTFLFNQNLGGRNIGINKIRALVLGKSFHGDLKLNKLGGVGDTVYPSQQVHPEAGCLSFFIPFSKPVLYECFCCLTLFCICCHENRDLLSYKDNKNTVFR